MAKVLLVEDDDLLSRMYQGLFESCGYKVALALDGEEGLKSARSNRPDIIILDMMMPKMYGLQVLAELKHDDKLKNIPVIILSNMAGDHDSEAALKMGAERYVVKSQHTPKQVEAIVREVLSSSKDRQ